MITLALAAICCLGAQAQEKLFNSASVQSPVINKDGTVTFNLFAPKAVKVEVTGDFLPTQQIDVPGYGKYDAPGVAQLVEGKNGVWSYTTDKLAPEMYSYTFNIDGMTGVKDPANIYVNRDIVSFTNIFIVSDEKGDKGDLYRVNEVPHGNLSNLYACWLRQGRQVPRALPASRSWWRRERLERTWARRTDSRQPDCNG